LNPERAIIALDNGIAHITLPHIEARKSSEEPTSGVSWLGIIQESV